MPTSSAFEPFDGQSAAMSPSEPTPTVRGTGRPPGGGRATCTARPRVPRTAAAGRRPRRGGRPQNGRERCRYRHRPRSPVPIALDESLATRGLDAVLDADAADAVVLKPMALGGPDRALAAARRAREAGVEPVVTTTIDAVVARTAAVHVAAAIPDVSPAGSPPAPCSTRTSLRILARSRTAR